MRGRLVVFLGLLLVVFARFGARAEESALDKIVDANIPAQSLGEAVLELSRQSGKQIIVASEAVEGRTAPAVRGKMTIGEALDLLLKGTALEPHVNGPDTIALGPRRTSLDDLLGDVYAAASPTGVGTPEVAGESPGVPPPPEVTSQAETAIPRSVEEIVVTANRRAQNLQDVSSSLAVVGGEELERTGAASFEDYVFKVPGLNVVDDGTQKKISIRGISNFGSVAAAFGTASPVGLYLNDTPIQGSGDLPDLGLYDLERIEVLKGPQGTLYGEGAQGGAIKMLLNKADPSGIYAKGDVSVGQTRFASGLNHGVNAMVNAPLFGSWALRLVGTERQSQGFIDYFEVPKRDANDVGNLMGRVHLDGEVWKGFDLSAQLLHQRQRVDQFAQVFESDGDLRNHASEPQFSNTDFTLAALTLDYDLGFAVATSSTSGMWNDRDLLAGLPPTAGRLLSGTAGLLLPTPLPVIPGVDNIPENTWVLVKKRQFSIAQELRLVSSADSWLKWVGGVFYRARENSYLQDIDDDAPCCPPPAGTGLAIARGAERFAQVAGFGEITLELPWNLELLTGVRVFRESAVLDSKSFKFKGVTYPLSIITGGPDGEIGPNRFETSTIEVTPKVSLSWYVDDLRMLYALAANGVRSGGTNVNATWTEIPAIFAPDSLWTFEIGAKTRWLDGLLTANLALFHNDWRDLQVFSAVPANLRGTAIVYPTAGGIFNAGRAFSRGMEVELLALPQEGLTLGFNMALMDGEITKGDPAGTIPDHSRLPELSALTYSASAAYEIPRLQIFGLTPRLSFDTQCVGERSARPPSASGFGGLMAGFQLFNLMAGLVGERWEINLGVHNLTDARPQIGVIDAEPDRKTIGPPRTLTTTVGFRWG